MSAHRRQADPILDSFVRASSGIDADRSLAAVIRDHAEPVIRSVVGRRWHVSSSRRGSRSVDNETAEDIHGEAVTQVIARLAAMREQPDEPISDFRAYVAVATYRACDRQLRHKYPRRWSLKNRLRYLFSHHPGLAVWDTDHGIACGFAEWRDQGRPIERSERWQGMRAATRESLPLGVIDSGRGFTHPADGVAAILRAASHPIELDELVSVMSTAWDVREEVTATEQADDEGGPIYDRVVDTRADVAREVDERDELRWLWSEIRSLPPRQCAALLLNLRDSGGRGVIALLPIRGAATLREIAAAIEMSAERFAEIWNDLPYDDQAIAELLGITRQQVINLRKVARERLIRRRQAREALS